MNLENLKKICCLGAGTMGPGIALSFALAGYQVHMYSRSAASIQRSFALINDLLEKFAEHGLVEFAQISQIKAQIRGTTNLEEAAEDAGFVIEAIPENLTLKQELFAKMEQLCPPATVFASSTSGLSTTALAMNLQYKERFIVAHFWNPPHLIPLVEVAPGESTSQNTVEFTTALLQKIGKKPVVLKKEALGLIGNRLQLAMLREALALVETGVASKEAVDTTIKYALGRRLAVTGPLESVDLGGLDIFQNIASYLIPDLCSTAEVSPLLRGNVHKGRLGAKTGAGFYDWTPDSLQKIKKLREDDLLSWLNKDKKGYLDY
ncbi:MAG: 3-hydroxyacyl-CoA dehydrogenase family protein [Desulfitobacteriia bacterium]|jgi:3-hydroxybutyryl-CoA dehydrogenase